MMTTTLSSAMAILVVVGQWFILEKMGEKGWKALIPFYGTYLLFKHAWNTKMFWISLALSLAGFTGCLAGVGLMLAGSTVAAIVTCVVAVVVSVAALVVDVRFIYELCKCFGHGVGYTVGMLFIEPVFILVLGLGKDEFVAA